MSTPEGKVKDFIRKFLAKQGLVPASKAAEVTGPISGWYYMPVQGAFAVRGILDFVGCYRGRFFVIEAKAGDNKPTGHQEDQLKAIGYAGGANFVVSEPDHLEPVFAWMQRC